MSKTETGRAGQPKMTGDSYKDEIHVKCVLSSTDGGKTWDVFRQDYASAPHQGRFGKGKLIDFELFGPLVKKEAHD